MTSSAAVRRFAPRTWARAAVLCFPHAGGAASHYRRWATEASWDVEVEVVQYPGREDRYAEEAPSGMAQLVTALSAELAGRDGLGPMRPTVLFGHSMGAAVAYEVARRLSAAGRPPAALVVSGQPAPALTRAGTLHRGSAAELLDDLRRLGGTETGVVDDTELMEALLPTIRRDYELIETYRPLPGAPLRLPVSVFHGDTDPEVTAQEAEGWRAVTDGPCTVTVLSGGHFCLETHRTDVLRQLVAHARDAASAAHGRWASTP